MRTPTLLLLLLVAPQIAGGGLQVEPQYVYVSSTVIHDDDAGIFSSFAVTNTTRFWFNPVIYLINEDGQVVGQATPLLKGFGTWHDLSGNFLKDDFNGSAWIVSPQPLVVNSYTHQIDGNGQVTLLASSEAKPMNPAAVEGILEALAAPEDPVVP